MADKSVTKVQSAFSPRGESGQKYLASGISVAMRMWDDLEAGTKSKPAKRDYETVGFVLDGSAELHIEGQMVLLEKGDSYVVPKGSQHHYKVLKNFSAVEATHPPAHAHGRDE